MTHRTCLSLFGRGGTAVGGDGEGVASAKGGELGVGQEVGEVEYGITSLFEARSSIELLGFLCNFHQF